MAKKVADQLVDTLEKAGVRRIYAVTGDSLNEVNEACLLYTSPSPRDCS